jgi:hypothetical protein
MSKERDIEILTFKIVEIKKKIENFKKYGISEKKIKDLEIMQMRYEDQLAEIELG